MWYKLLLMLLIVPGLLFGQTITITDSDIQPGQTVNWTANNVYLLDGLVYAESLAVVNIQAGTVLKFKSNPSTGDNTSALIITRGAKIYANGTAQNPIIMTAESDDLNDPFDLLPTDRGLWGGLILLGNAVINTADGRDNVEGIDPNETRARYGGNDDNDDSGVLRYVSLRHGGSELAPGDEINALTLGAVGSGATIEYVEAYANLDDGFEWFGGAVNTKYLVSAFNADDGFDWDQGFRGKHQFWFVLQGDDQAGRSAEQDGGTDPEDGVPYSIPIISNVTYVGPGASAFPQGDGGQMLIFRDNSGGKYYNSIFTEYNGGQGGAGITVEDNPTGEDSRARLEAGDLALRNNIWFDFGNGNALSNIAPQSFVADSLANNDNSILDPQLINLVRSQVGGLDPRPNPTGPAASGAIPMGDPFFDQVSYYGAFDPNQLVWIRGWTALAQEGVLKVKENPLGNGVIPDRFTLGQNYPNPFNPTTTIDFEVASSGHVQVVVYNSLGQHVETLVNGYRNAGEYRLTWEAPDLPSGIYFYQLRAGSTVLTRKMILMQ